MADDFNDERLIRLMAGFAAIEKHIQWRLRLHSDSTASENFADNHANGMVCGPGGMVANEKIMIGASLLGRNVRHPDHDHAPEKTDLVMTDGEFSQGDSDWFSPGCGGSFCNPHGIKHAMRTGAKLLFAFWVLHRCMLMFACRESQRSARKSGMSRQKLTWRFPSQYCAAKWITVR